MAAHQIPCGDPGSPARFAGAAPLAGRRRVTSGHLGRNGPARVQFYRSPRGPAMTPSATRHIPVLGAEAVAMLKLRDGGIYVDATFGAGGYSRAILDAAANRVIGIDRDRTAIAGGFDLVDQSNGRLTLVEDRFSNLAEVCAAQSLTAVDGVVMDVGVSSMQV